MHAYADGRAPGLQRVQDLGVEAITFPASATSEDIAMLLADEKGATLIVAVGTHATLVEFLDKGRGGMASTFLTRLRLGGKLVDAKGVSRLYRSRISTAALVVLVLAALRRHRLGPRRVRRRPGLPRPAASTNGTASCSGWRTSSRDRLPLSPGLADRRLPGGRARDRHRHHRAQRADPRPTSRTRSARCEQDKRSLEDRTQTLQAQLDTTDAFAEAVAPALVDGALAGAQASCSSSPTRTSPPDTVDAGDRPDRRGRRHGDRHAHACSREYSDPSTATQPAELRHRLRPARRASRCPTTDDAGQLVGSLLAQVLMIPPGGSRARPAPRSPRCSPGCRRSTC